jgi:hypothetical protein
VERKSAGQRTRPGAQCQREPRQTALPVAPRVHVD